MNRRRGDKSLKIVIPVHDRVVHRQTRFRPLGGVQFAGQPDRRFAALLDPGGVGVPECVFAHVTLTRSERSPIAALVTEMLESTAL